MSERVQKVLARAGVASRRKAEELISAGRVSVNGVRASLGAKVAKGDEIRVDGNPIKAPLETVAYLLNKPVGYVSTAEDELGRPTVMELLPELPGLHPVGRLDIESEGMLLLTNDGELTLQLTHPRYGHEKEYRVWTREGSLGAAELGILERGLELEDGPARAVVAKLAEGGCILVLQEGRKRQVRRMLAAVGFSVTRLLRTRIGRLELGDLASGAYRQLDSRDFKLLGYTQKE